MTVINEELSNKDVDLHKNEVLGISSTKNTVFTL